MLRGNKTNNTISEFLMDIYKLKKGTSKHFGKKHNIKPMEDASSLEFLCERNNSSLFMLVSNSKKRPNGCYIGRTFDNTVLDLVEFEIKNYKGL